MSTEFVALCTIDFAEKYKAKQCVKENLANIQAGAVANRNINKRDADIEIEVQTVWAKIAAVSIGMWEAAKAWAFGMF